MRHTISLSLKTDVSGCSNRQSDTIIPAWPSLVLGKVYFFPRQAALSILAHSAYRLIPDADSTISAKCAPPTLDAVSKK